jgi:hypothetical protein
MTIEEFNNTGFACGMQVKYHGDGKVYPICSVDFEEALIGIQEVETDDEDAPLDWKRCENCTIVAA